MIKLRYPVINANGADTTAQIQSFLHQLIDDLNFALENIEAQASETRVISASGASSSVSEEKNPQASFNAIKSLIIKSADIVEAYYEEFNKKLEGSYVAQSEFGTFYEQTTQDIIGTPTGIKQMFENLQEISDAVDILEHALIDVNAYINAGLLDHDDSGVPIYGLEIGQRNEIDGEEVFNKYARFTADKLSFFDNNGIEVAYVSDKKLHITHVEITGSLTLGGFVDTVLSDKSVITRWVVGGDG